MIGAHELIEGVLGVFSALLSVLIWFLKDKLHHVERGVAAAHKAADEAEARGECKIGALEQVSHELKLQLEGVKRLEPELRQLEERTRQLEHQGVAHTGVLEQRTEDLRRVDEKLDGLVQLIGELRQEMAVRYVSRNELAALESKLTKLDEKLGRKLDELFMRLSVSRGGQEGQG